MRITFFQTFLAQLCGRRLGRPSGFVAIHIVLLKELTAQADLDDVVSGTFS
jgi:hypothetical protein